MGITATLLFFFSVLLVPMLGLLAGVFTPLPTLLFFYRWGSPIGYWIPAGALGIGALLLGYLGMARSLPYFLEMLVLGVFLGAAMRRHWSLERSVFTASLFIFGLGFAAFWFTGDNPENMVQSIEKDLHDTVTTMLQHFGGASAQKQAIEGSLQVIIPIMVRLLPGAGFSSALVVPLMNILITMRYCRIHHIPQPPWGEWSLWKAPEFLVWLVVASGFSLLLPMGILKLAGLNVLIVLATVYLFQGLSIAAFYFERWKVPRIFRLIGFGILLLQQFVTLGAVLVGLFDVWIDFRRLSQKSSEAN